MPERGHVFGEKKYSGSVKDVYAGVKPGTYAFSFSDRYSIFDWGEMPDAVPGKGEALAVMGDLFFRLLGDAKNWLNWHIPESYPKFWRDSLLSSHEWSELRRSGFPHHSLGLVSESGAPLNPGQRSRYLSVMAIDRPAAEWKNGAWDYSAYQERRNDTLVPLEVVFRFGAPDGSSFLERVKSMPGYAQSFGFAETPRAGEKFPYPIVEYFTKLEPTDRFLTSAEAKQLAALTDKEFDSLGTLTLLLALRLRDVFASMGLELWDGKFEFSFTPGFGGDGTRGFRLVDSIGPDELRLISANGVHFSKEFLRRVYRDTPWYESLQKAKALAKERGERDWKKICKEELKQFPEPLTKEVYETVRDIYPALAEALARDFFHLSVYEGLGDVPSVSARMKRYT